MGRRKLRPRRRCSVTPTTTTTMTTCKRCGALFSSGLVVCAVPLGVTSPTQTDNEWGSRIQMRPGECPRCGHITARRQHVYVQ
jgi:transcription elongation factor Elf1